MIRTLGPIAFTKIKLCCSTLYNIRFIQLVYGEKIKKNKTPYGQRRFSFTNELAAIKDKALRNNGANYQQSDLQRASSALSGSLSFQHS